MNTLFNEYGFFEGTIPQECVEDCSHSGECYDDCYDWVDRLCFTVPREQTIKYLREFGAWSIEELNDMTDEDLAIKVLWIACNDIKDGQEWLGLVH
jgi:hypothetical protein